MKVHTFQSERASEVRTAMRYLDDQGGRVLLRDLQTALIDKFKFDISQAKRVCATLKRSGFIVSDRDGKNWVTELTSSGQVFCGWLLDNPAYGTNIRGVIDIPKDTPSIRPLGVVIETRVSIDEYRALQADKSLAPAFIPVGAEVYVRIDGELKEVPVV